MWIVRLALRRPYTCVVTALLLLLLTPFVLLRTPTDIFPSINIPVVSVVWLYNGLSAQEIEQRLIYNHERMISTTVNDIEHIESSDTRRRLRWSKRWAGAGRDWSKANGEVTMCLESKRPQRVTVLDGDRALEKPIYPRSKSLRAVEGVRN